MSEPGAADHLLRCPICAGPARRILTELSFSDGEVAVRVEGVPAVVCDDCGEIVVDGPLGVRIGDEVAHVLRLLQEHRGRVTDPATVPRVVVLATAPTRDAA
jgi:YgiT-type zinc finger domain-containing protein